MSAEKEQAIRLIQALPENVTLDDAVREIYFKAQVDAGLEELDEGKGIPHAEIEERMAKWLSR